MQRHHLLTAVGALALFGAMGTASASGALSLDKGDKGSLNAFPVHAVPVLVNVNSKGRITDLASAYQLSPSLNRLLRKNVEEMISQPAVDQTGRAIPSQFVLNLVLDSSQRDDGNYDTLFRYVSTQPVPAGRWAWAHIDGHQLALMDRTGVDGGNRSHVIYRDHYPMPQTRDYTPPPVQQQPQPVIASPPAK